MRNELTASLAILREHGLRRERKTLVSPQGSHVEVDGKRYLAFCSNDYLGLANDPRIVDAVCEAARTFGVGAGASHLISGHALPHEQLERALAGFVGCDRALLFSSGYLANIGVIPALVGKDGAVFSDALNHASMIDGIRLSRASVEIYPHCDMIGLDKALARSNARRKLVASETVFSMDGDLAPVTELAQLCERHGAWLLLDDAHGFGVLGRRGRGALSHFHLQGENIIYLGTLGKAAGGSGAFIAGSTDMIEWLIQTARSYIFTTASPPALAAGLLTSLKLIEAEEDRRERLRKLIFALRKGAQGIRWPLLPSETAIQPLIVGENEAALALMEFLKSAGIWVPAIRPPTVPKGSARLRISLSASHSLEDVERLVAALHRAAAATTERSRA
jgi:8-amino-7-oxononanoate synthase